MWEVRDAVSGGYIYATQLERKIIDSPEFQRLRRISQMHTASLVYPGGSYSRYYHSLGVMDLMHKSLMHILGLQSQRAKRIKPLLREPVVLRKEPHLKDLEKTEGRWWNSRRLTTIIQSSRLAGLVHDIGHGPFSHLFECACEKLKEKKKLNISFNHEIQSKKIVEEKLRDKIGRKVLQSTLDILNPRGPAPQFLRQLICNIYTPVSCDTLDYLPRDAYFTGTTEIGMIDTERILDSLRIFRREIRISETSLDALVNYYKASQSMYSSVYYHRTSRIFDFMLSDALLETVDLIKEITKDVDSFLRYDDQSLIREIKERANGQREKRGNYKEAGHLIEAFLNRTKLFEEIHVERIGLSAVIDIKKQLDDLKKKLTEIAQRKDLKIHIDFYDIRSVRVRLEELFEWLRKTPIIYREKGEILTLAEVSENDAKALGRYTMMFRIFVEREHEQYRGPTGKARQKLIEKIKTKAEKETKRIIAQTRVI